MDSTSLWAGLLWPLLRLILFICIGLFAANLIEAAPWSRKAARFALPLARLGRLGETTAAAFSLALVSGASANALLSEKFQQGRISWRELVLSNLLNSLPAYFLHLPTMILVALPFLGAAVAPYVGLTLLAALGRTLFVLGMGRALLPPLPEANEQEAPPSPEKDERPPRFFRRGWTRFKKRIPTILLITIPLYILVYFLHRQGLLHNLKQALAGYAGFFSVLPPEALATAALHAVEASAGLASAGAFLDAGVLGTREVVLALLLGNFLGSPVRALRHQFPYYAGIYHPRIAIKLIACNQSLRAASILLAGSAYYFLT